ncbi:family 61 putative glycoside hydrolase [Pseudomassariella vexata]|uniref:lytic cellulose monooxygenase (C4-dehydrogenating) n=1 Tax=Pseudomassariella vexata TaxID=1141098 RepID=A0A1Y2E885_9PEZI|nr:family 61 putative glycoside hydrolase [Pseudomassariella vexata]ORY67496.1 family 61 putative glycoside hydrolase [Pseudomassariella vexata]
MLFILALLAAAPLVSAHGAVTSYIIGGKEYLGYEGFSPVPNAQIIQRQWPDYNPIMTVSDAKMTCNGGTSAPISATIAAGENITAVWKQWTHQQGPVMVWMYPCSDFNACDGKGKNWFKIDQVGLWGDVLNSNNWGTALVYKDLKYSSQIPKNIKPGKYLIRHELLALHQANTPQFYPECAQIEVTGSGTAVPSGAFLTSIPGYAAQSDPGVMVDIYMGKATTYTPPGPAVWTA